MVRRTGGLADTVKDVDAADAGDAPNGFTFDGVDEASEDGALDRALAYFQRKDWWAEVRRCSCHARFCHIAKPRNAHDAGQEQFAGR